MEKLRHLLRKIDGKGYKAYKDIQGTYTFGSWRLAVDYVQGDPFASPSKIRVLVPRKNAGYEASWDDTKHRKIRTEDFIARLAAREIRKKGGKGAGGTGKSGLIMIDAPGQEVLERTAVSINDKEIGLCLSIGLPARGRRVLGKQAEQLFFEEIPAILQGSIFNIDTSELSRAHRLADQQGAIRGYMKENGIISFIADGAVLPRESGVSSRPLREGKVVPFVSPASMSVEIQVPHKEDPVTGMAVKEGITVIAGGGYHGKSTLLKAIELGVYDHIEGDGREFVLSHPDAVKVRAEDGRKITGVNISPFINNLPYEKNTHSFTTENASGSTSQAANIMEGMESRASVLLIDEDTSATNFMIRDARMQALVAKEKEPITPFIDRVKHLYEERNISTILVMGGSGDYFDVADKVIRMEEYIPADVTAEARDIARKIEFKRESEAGGSFTAISERIPLPQSLDSRKGKKSKVTARGLSSIQYGRSDIQLQYVEQLVDQSQTRMIAEILFFLEREKRLSRQEAAIPALLDFIEEKMDNEGPGSFTLSKGQHPGDLARPRRHEIAAALNRLRTLGIKK
ncbi:ABC-ATPase domain-containing protein [Bacillus marinisedimentorum]|uniref:ABC-ATPase domain-containing protein n=1 Tax=Bacillus marinisedimentorum TaxID=1821260 RepID=UPI000872B0C6|nr:ABC-ATPase domain-containing protein [Bacillus marinisedimentorum]